MPFTFWEQAALNAFGPLVVVVLGTIAVGSVTAVLSRRYQDRRSELRMRQATSTEMFEVAYDLYFRCVHLDRARRHGELDGEDLINARKDLEGVYVTQRGAMGVLWTRIKLFYGSDSYTYGAWHRVVDLLTTLYFSVIEAPDARLDEVRSSVASDRHTGLSVQQLTDVKRIQGEFEPALLRASNAVVNGQLQSRPHAHTSTSS